MAGNPRGGMLGDVGDPLLVWTLPCGEVPVQQVGGRGRVDQVLAALAARWFALNLRSHDPGHEFVLDDQTPLDPKR